MGLEALMQNPNYFLQHPFNYHGEDVDYVTLTFGYGASIKIPCLNKLGPGAQGAITRDFFGRWYFSFGETGGISISAGTLAIVAGRIINGDREHLSETLAAFIPGKSSNLTIGFGVSIGQSQSGDIKAMEIGFSTPQISISNNWTDEIESAIKQRFSFW